MMFNVDKRVFEILREQGVSCTWEQFRAAYAVRIAERDASPKPTSRAQREAKELAQSLAQEHAEYMEFLASVNATQVN